MITVTTDRSATLDGELGRDLLDALRGAWVDVDLDALEANYRRLEERMLRPDGGRAGILAVLKADAYGHGAQRVARVLEELGIDGVAVALLEEAAELRRAGFRRPILALGPAQPPQLPLFTRYRVTPTVSGLDQIALWREWARRLGRPQPIHLKVDTGMNRLGVGLGDVSRALEMIRAEPGLVLEGVLSHFADAENPESPRNLRQQERFDEALELLDPEERSAVTVHLANSAGALHRPSARRGLVRMGLALFGLDPAGRDRDLTPVMSVRARLVTLQAVETGARLGYGGTYRMERPGRIAVVPVGYADGYPKGLGNRAQALVSGRRVPVAGAVSMDLTLLDVTDAGPEVKIGDEAVLLGRQGDEEIDAFELARSAGTIPYEILCRLGQRLPRRYFRQGRLAGAHSGLIRGGL